MSDSTLTAACDPERWIAQSRADLLAASGLKSDDLTRAVNRNRKLLHAKKIKHFAHEGIVTDSRIDDDSDAQLRAIDLFYDLLGVKAPRAQSSQQAMAVEVVIDQVSGQVIVRAATRGGGSTQAPTP